MKKSLALFDSPFYHYHDLSKHTLDKLMASNHSLDWSNQPDPFRRYEGAKRIHLPHPDFVSELTYFEAMEVMLALQGITRGSDLPEPRPGDAAFISHLLFYSMAISAWKQVIGTRNRWSLRVNPSSGDLHPTETHLFVKDIHGLDSGAYHYFVPGHELELRCPGPGIAEDIWRNLGQTSSCPQLIVCFSSIFWREAWKYRDRAYRYCHHDMGHALASLMLSAAILGWSGEIIGDFPDREMAAALDLSGGDEKPALLVGLRPGQTAPAAGALRQAEWLPVPVSFDGTANELSPTVVHYSSIDTVYKSTCLTLEQWREKMSPAESGDFLPRATGRYGHISACGDEVKTIYQPDSQPVHEGAHRTVRKRRSAVDMDGRQRMKLEHLSTMLVSATRGFNSDFQSGIDWTAPAPPDGTGHHLIDLYLYIHRVDGVEPGIYYFDRLSQSLVPLSYSDQREAAKFYSCFQDIASDGCFAVSMIANLDQAFELHGNRAYRYAHYEAGWIGQWLYLSATALGYESTGIGCFVDDLINRHLALPPGHEVLYNFTVGRAVHDPRLTTLPSYEFPDPTSL